MDTGIELVISLLSNCNGKGYGSWHLHAQLSQKTICMFNKLTSFIEVILLRFKNNRVLLYYSSIKIETPFELLSMSHKRPCHRTP
jgi:hypothetical protein